MIVEDNPINQRILTRFLASLGIPTVTARDGLEALELLYHRVDDTTTDPTPTPPLTLGGTLIAPPPAYPTPSRPHDSTKRIRRRTGMEDVEIVFMDVEMPRMDGITATREIRRLEREEEGGGRKRKFGEDEDGVEEEGGGGEKRRRSDHVRSGLEAGMDEYVIKPWKAEDIERVCRTAE
ncbi:hypothetical protein BC829DRAFT_379298 [Chytridium lagenaria]|nr:hypothetical protein BC829DRAFT_379298 [Chytridium lagenaria]